MTALTIAEATTPMVVTRPGVYDLPEDVYHGDPVPGGSLSSSGAKKLLASCPAIFRYEQLNPPKSRRVFEFGTVVHGLVLGSGPEVVIVEAENWRTNKAKAEAEEAHARGAVPVLRKEYQQAVAMADALRKDPVAGGLFQPGRGLPERSLFWQDVRSGVWLRARLDWLPNRGPGRMVVLDYKTAASAHPAAIRKAVAEYGYHQQAAWYMDAVRALGLARDVAFLFVFQEKEPPYLPTVVELDRNALREGRELNRKAISLYRECVTSGRWPGYSDSIELVRLPAWAQSPRRQETL
ncbi:PD-(D/E)XK nuclease-like domain-containing protein [Microtetraspora malaysiensis]|uniref:PD-(D/E)XK nuclease-like domain-containing protein n=1 Tax=Microtetraspora malaysiensis TaxID=161358 RepID=A0ABW6SK93_9ACTN